MWEFIYDSILGNTQIPSSDFELFQSAHYNDIKAVEKEKTRTICDVLVIMIPSLFFMYKNIDLYLMLFVNFVYLVK